MTPDGLKNHSDAELVELYQKTRDSRAMGELYKRYSHLVLGTCIKYLEDKEVCKDLTMDIFEWLVEELPTQQIQSFKHWLYKLTQNKCLTYLRTYHQEVAKNDTIAKKMKKSREILMENTQFSTLINRHPTKIGETELLDAVNSLSEGQKSCVQLFYWKKLTYKEIAAATGYDVSIVKSHIQNGKRKIGIYLTKNLKNDGGVEGSG